MIMGCGFSSDKRYMKPRRQNRNFPNGEVNQNGLKIRLRRRIKLCMAGDNPAALQETITLFDKHRMHGDPDYAKALHRLEYMRLKRDLRDGLRRRHASVLNRAIKKAKHSDHAQSLAKQIEVCRKLRDHLLEISKYSHDILHMEQTTISEIRSYDHPPECVFQVMASVYKLLGYPEENVQTWQHIQGLMGRTGKESLMKMIEDYDVTYLEEERIEEVRKVLEKNPLAEVRLSSNGVATFHSWATETIQSTGIHMEETTKRRGQKHG